MRGDFDVSVRLSKTVVRSLTACRTHLVQEGILADSKRNAFAIAQGGPSIAVCTYLALTLYGSRGVS